MKTEIEEYEKWLKSLEQDIYPYIVFVGELQAPEIFVQINGSQYNFGNHLTAVESCYKCLTALKAFPYMCDFVWSFIDKLVYGISSRKGSSLAVKLLTEINKL